jgi:hypothetical protein
MAANQLLTTSKITYECLEVLENQLTFSSRVNRNYDSQFSSRGGKIGATVNVRKPSRYQVTSGQALVVQPSVETYVPVTLTNQDHVDLGASSVDYTLNINDFREQFIVPAMAALANKIDYNGLQMAYKNTYNFVGTPGQLTGTPTSAQALLAIAQAGQKLDENACPRDGKRSAIISPATNTGLVTANASLFNPQTSISNQYTNGRMGSNVLGFDFYGDQNVPMYTAGTQNGTFATGGAAQAGGNTIQADATTAYTLTTAAITGTLTAGTVFTIAGVFAVNPQSRQSTGVLQNFVVKADTLASATSVGISPYPIFSGSFQNVTSTTNSIGASATCTILSGLNGAVTPQNIFMHQSAFTLACADLKRPTGNGGSEIASSKAAGLSLRLIKDWYDVQSDNFYTRIDVLYGYAALYPELATRVTG